MATQSSQNVPNVTSTGPIANGGPIPPAADAAAPQHVAVPMHKCTSRSCPFPRGTAVLQFHPTYHSPVSTYVFPTTLMQMLQILTFSHTVRGELVAATSNVTLTVDSCFNASRVLYLLLTSDILRSSGVQANPLQALSTCSSLTKWKVTAGVDLSWL